MKKEEYLEQLKKNLNALDIEEMQEAVSYYSNYFDEAQDDEKVCEELGSPENLANTIVEKFANAVAKTEHSTKESNNAEDTKKSFNNSESSGLFYSFNKDSVTDLKLKFVAAEVVLIQSGSKFCIETRGVEKSDFYCSLENGKLEVSNHNRFNLDFFNHDRKRRFVPRILVSVPEHCDLNKLALSCSAGSLITKKSSITTKKLKINAAASHVVINDICSNKSSIKCGMAEVVINGKLFGESNVDCGAGHIKLCLNQEKSECSFDARVGLGELKFNEDKKSGVCKVVDNEKKENHFSVNCGLGSVEIYIK